MILRYSVSLQIYGEDGPFLYTLGSDKKWIDSLCFQRYLEGGIATGFHHVEKDEYSKYLYQVKGKRNVRVSQVIFPISVASQATFIVINIVNIVIIVTPTLRHYFNLCPECLFGASDRAIWYNLQRDFVHCW